MKTHAQLTRREFAGVAGAAAAASIFTIVPRNVLGGPGQTPPSEKVNMAAVGAGGQAGGDIAGLAQVGANFAAFCDVDDKKAADTYKKYPNVKKFKDFRKMLDTVDKEIDAVLVGTPDHFHAVATMGAIKRGKHVYC
ncbi:MAG: Gfo/Idh/MocA family oxidoreductase [Candidatus Sumerlaeota bacterium]|nr:Gfo/Idh/MocA family oxidoreductase [Candidatus Sumerlaeota bacterium]